ncbi:MAG TPA: protein-disulfide reductase DsbD domain-containing protein [Planctomycetota bacterium]|nr:protein-disulfide reductase DsbD domain-containing protein [Planctomycetota bacterium]
MDARTRWFTFLGLLTALLAPLPAQGKKFALEAAFEPATAKPGDEVTLVLNASVEIGWHAYGSLEKTNIPVTLKPGKLQLGGLELVGAAEIPPGDRHTTVIGDSFPLPNEFTVKQKVKVPASMAAGEVTLSGALDYQICDENMCLPPTGAKFSAKLKVAGGAPAAPVLGTKPGLKLDPDAKVTIVSSFEPAQVRAGETATLVLDVDVHARYHAYGSLETTNIPVALDAGKLVHGALELAGPPDIPPGVKTQQFGMDTYPLPHHFQIKQKLRVPAGTGAGAVLVKGVLDYQICDENSCDPPGEGPFEATLQVLEGGTAAPGLGVKPGLRLEGDDDKVSITAHFDPATARAGENATLVIDVTVLDETYHAYGALETINVPVSLDTGRLERGALELVGGPDVPLGEKTEVLGEDSYPLPHRFQVKQVLAVPAGTPAGAIPVKGELEYQICDANHCLEKTDGSFAATLTVEAGEARTAAAAPAGTAPHDPTRGNPFGGSLWLLILACVGGGLFALAMPCTYPMIPITFSFFTKQAEKRHGHVLPLALTYGFGIVVMFTLVGALLSTVIVDVVNHWLTNLVIGAMFLFFAFVLFGWVNLNPPQWLTRAAGKASHTGGYLGVFFMGAALVITSFTCTAPIVGSLLANVAQFGTARVAFGMAIFGLTMALPFVALSLMPSKVKSMPRSGEWMETLKVSLGFVELAAALKFVSMVDFALGWQILPRELFLLQWTTIFAMWSMYLFGILRKKGTPNEGVSNGRMAGGMFVALLATYFLFGALGFRLDFYTTNFIPGYSAESVISRGGADGGVGEAGGSAHVLGKHHIVLDDQPKAIEVAKAEDKLLLYNFTGFN